MTGVLEIRPPAEWLGDTDEACQAREEAKAILDKHNITVASIMCGTPSLQTAKEEMAEQLAQVSAVMDLCVAMGGAVYTNAGPAGYDPDKSLPENVAVYKEVYAPVAELAEQKGVKLAFENWPGRYPFAPGANLPVTPEAWGVMFEALQSDFIGLEFDPSHLMWQWIDPYEAAREFADKIFMVHLKDTQMFREKVKRSGTHMRGWWTYRLPGFGELDWHKFFTVFYETGYTGDMVIEHEDPVFSGDRRDEGFVLSGNFLRKVMLS